MQPRSPKTFFLAALAFAWRSNAAPAGHAIANAKVSAGSPMALSLAAAMAPSLQIPPPMPAAWPPIDQQHFIPDSFLQDPLVQDAWAYVQSVVPANVLNIAVSTYINGPTVTYNSDPVANCYWPYNLCMRTTATQYYQPDVFQCPQQSTWGLAFDDGPTNDTLNHYDSIAIRQQLDKMKIKATFFIVGTNLIMRPNIVLDEYNDGHQIGVHTWTHHPLTACTNEQIVAEIKYTEALIYNTTGQVPNFFRPPYGDIDDRVRAVLNALGYTITVWSKDDFAADQSSTSSTIEQGLVQNVTTEWFAPNQPGFVSLSHDITPFTSHVVLDYLTYVDQNRANIHLTIEPVGTCVNKPWYRSGTNAPGGSPSGSPNTSPSGSAPGSSASASSSPSAGSGNLNRSSAVRVGGSVAQLFMTAVGSALAGLIIAMF